MTDKTFHKTKVYSRMFVRQENKQKAVAHDGWSDNKYEYYKVDEVTWFAIDPMIGMSIGSAENRKACYKFVHSEKVQKALEEKKKTADYAELCSEWYKMLVDCGVYMENPIK